MANESLTPGQVVDGFRFKGGDPNDQASWEAAPLKAGEMVDGFRFKGGDPNAQDSWEQVKQDRSFLGASAEAGGRALLAAGARIIDELNPFTLSERDAAALYKDNPERLKEITEKHAALALSRFANEQTKRAREVMQEVKPTETGAISGKPLGELEYATLDPEKAAYLSPTRVAGDVLGSLPTTLALGVSAYLTKGASARAGAQAEAQALARGATQAEAQAAGRAAAIEAGANTMARTGAAGEGVVGYAQQRNQTMDEAMNRPLQDYEQSPAYQGLLAQGYSPEAAKLAVASNTAQESGLIAGAVDAGTNLIGGRVLGKIIGEGGRLGARTGKGFLTEAATETVQSGGEQLGQNLAMRNIDPNQSLTEGVGEAMAAGGVVGGVTGGGFAAVLGGGQSPRRQMAEQQLKQAGNAADAAAAADALAGSVDELTAAVDDYLRVSQAQQPVAQATPAARPTIQELQARADREAELLAQADQAGTDFERRMALEQLQAARPAAPERTAEQFADLTPMDERQAQMRLNVMRDEAAQGFSTNSPLELAVVPHPSQAGRFAIGKQALPSLELQAPTPAGVTPGEAQYRIEAAALAGKEQQRRAEDQPRQDMISRAMANIEARGGVASPYEAELLRAANMGQPFDRVDPSIGRPASTDEKLTVATGVPVGQEAGQGFGARESGSETQRLAALQQTNNASMAEQEARNAANAAQAERGTQAAIEQTSQPAAAPDANQVLEALKTPGAQRSAEQVSTIRQAQARYSGSDFGILERAARGTFQLNAPERMRLDSLLKGSVAPKQQFTPGNVAPATAPLTGSRVLERLGQPTGGRIIVSDAKLSTQRAPVPGAVQTLRDGEIDHEYTVVDPGKLGATGRLLAQVARIFGKRLVAFQSETLKADGFVLNGDNQNIYLNTTSQMSPLAVFGHELTHLLKRDNPQAYAALQAVVERELGEGALAQFAEEYGDNANLEELTSDLVGNRFQEADFWADVFNEVAAQNPEGARGAITRMAAAITKAVNAFLKLVRQPGFQADAYVKDLNAIKSAVQTALAQYAQSQRATAMQMETETAQAQGQVDLTGATQPPAAQPPTAQLSRREADFTEPEQRQEVSTTRPVPAPKKGRTGTSYTEKWVIDGQDVRASQKHIDAVMKALRQYNTLSGKGNAKQLLQEMHDVVVENLLWLHDQVPANVRERAKLWYDGANRIATDWTAKYGVSLRQASGVLAVLSPQMDWFKNVSLAERVISIWKNRQNEVWTPAMTAWVESWVNASKDVDTKASRQAVLDEVKPLQGVALSELNDRQAALFIRAFDGTYHERQYRLVTPEGGFGEYVTNSDDGDASVTWGGFDTIEKAVSVLNDGSFKNIDEQLGSEHKVRNFYNNIISPGSADGHVTIDTHAVAAALVKALSGSSREVMDNFGGAGQNAETGASGTYGLFADAYRDAAAKRGILPREMQSITWEAVRALFPASIKDQLAPKVDAVWNRFKKGELTRDQAREEVRQLAGGIRSMAWEGSDFGKFAAEDGTSFNTELNEDPAQRQARTLPPEVAKDKVNLSLSASTMSIPGIAELQAAAARGDAMAHELLQNIALDNLRHLLAGTSAKAKANGATGLYGGYVESSLSATVSFADNDRQAVLAALAKFADNFNQEQVHVRRGVKAKPGTMFGDGSYATPVYRWELKKALTRKQIEDVIEKSGLYGLTFGDDFIEAYYVGDFNEEQFAAFERGIETAAGLVGKAAVSFGRSVERLWPYGQGAGAIGYDRIRGDVSAGSGVRSETAKRVAEYLNAVKGKDGKLQPGKVKTFDQAAEITPQQRELQARIAQVYESLPDNDLKNPNVRKAYQELAKEVIRQFKALPVKVEVMNGQGEPYANSTAMRRDILDNNHLFIFGTTPETFGPPGEDFSGHPLLEKTGLKDQNGYELLYNDLLRAVHDYYAHAMSPTQFGPKGEEAAWKNHMSMTSNMWARWALTAETRGQNSWVNFREGVQDLPVSEREFARQKAVLLPVEFSLTGDRTVDKPMKEFIAKLGERVQQGSKPVKTAKLSRQRAAESEYAEVERKYKGTPMWLKAPNNKDTNLTERQWVQVRTPSFKAWFGDWEKYAGMQGGVWNDADGEVSKVVDDNGEPLVVYHGAPVGGFSVFNTPGGDRRGDLGIFTTSNLEMAKSYRKGRAGEIEFENMDREELVPGDNVEAMSGYYPMFINLRNPQESDFEGAYWNGERPGQYIVENADGEQLYTPEGKAYFDSYDDASDFAATQPGATAVPAPEHYETTDSVVRDARRSGNDGAIIRNVVDSGSNANNGYIDEPSDVFVALDPGQLKSATQNTGEFSTRSDDLRFSRQRTPEFGAWFGDSKVVDANGEPLVVYHGTPARGIKVFDTTRVTTRSPMGDVPGTYFTADQRAASNFTREFGAKAGTPRGDLVAAYLRIENPLNTTAAIKKYRKQGVPFPVAKRKALEALTPENDGIIFEGDGVNPSEYVVFRPEQIKSITNERPTNNPDINLSRQRIVGQSSRAYTPEQLAMFERTGRTVEVPTIKERVQELRKDLGKKIAQGMFDQFRPIKDLSEKAYALARLSKGATGAFEAMLYHGKLSLKDGVYDGDQSGGFIDRVGKPLQGELEDFLWWVAANRADRLSKEDRENLFSADDIAAGKSLDNGTTDFDYTLQHATQGKPAGSVTRDRTLIYRDALKSFDEFNKNALDMAEQSGLIDAESRKLWEHEFYVPFYRVSDEDGAFVGGKIKTGLVRQEAFKRLKGGTDKLNGDLLANTLSNWGHLLDAAAKNRAAKATLDVAQQLGIAVESNEETVRSMAKSSGMRNHVVWFQDQGVKRYFLIEDPMLMTALTSLEYSGMRGPMMDAMSTFKHWLTVGVTASPAFKIRNLVRDSLQAVATAPLSYNVGKNLAEGIKASNRESQTYVSALASGGLIRFGTMLEGKQSDHVRRLIKAGVKDSTILDSESKITAFYEKFLAPGIEAYNELGNRGEEINRSSLFKQLTDQGVDQATAALMARDLMDFSMQGSWTTVRFLTQVVPFMNARLQGLYKLGRAAGEDPKRFSIVLGAVALASISLMLAYEDDEDWKKREDWDRNGNWWFKVGGVAFRIPKPFEVGAIATLAERGLEYFRSKEMTGKRLFENYRDLFLNSLSMNPIPQVFKPLLDLYSNKDSFTGRPIESLGMERLKSQYRYTANTSMVARGLSTATGGALSPVQYDHVLRGYFGWLGSFVVGAADMAVRPLTNEPTRPEADYWKVATQGIAQELGSASSRYVTQMYDQAKEVEEAYNTWRALQKDKRFDEARAFREDNKELLRKQDRLQAVKRDMTAFNERIRMIERSNLDPAEKKRQIQAIQARKDRAAQRVAEGVR